MSSQNNFRMPKTGDVWSHYKNSDWYTIIGMSRDDEGYAVVIYTPHRWQSWWHDAAPIYNQKIDRFLQEIDLGKPRFKFENGITDLDCYYLPWNKNPNEGAGLT